MGVFDRGTFRSGPDEADVLPYLCLSCETPHPVQFHSCPDCGSYDVRRAKWVDDR